MHYSIGPALRQVIDCNFWGATGENHVALVVFSFLIQIYLKMVDIYFYWA